MFKVLTRSVPAALAYLSLTSAAHAQSYSWSSWWSHWTGSQSSGATSGGSSSVPEIDASTGLLTVAAIAAALALAWEFKRRRQSS